MVAGASHPKSAWPSSWAQSNPQQVLVALILREEEEETNQTMDTRSSRIHSNPQSEWRGWEGRDLDLNGKQEQLQEQGTESIQEKQARIFLLAYQQQWAKTKGNPRTGGRADLPALHYHHGHHWTRRESSGGGAERLRRGAAWSGGEEDPGQHQPSEGGTGTGKARPRARPCSFWNF